MKIVRTWPLRPPAGRARVDDAIPRLLVDDFDFAELATIGDDLIVLEWDIAVDKACLQRFAAAARTYADRVIVAPYLLYADNGRPADVWAHRYWTPNRHQVGVGHVPDGAPWCNLPALGMTYLPQAVLRRYCDERPGQPLNDRWFSEWHYEHVEGRVPIIWDARPVHLHYQLPAELLPAPLPAYDGPGLGRVSV